MRDRCLAVGLVVVGWGVTAGCGPGHMDIETEGDGGTHGGSVADGSAGPATTSTSETPTGGAEQGDSTAAPTGGASSETGEAPPMPVLPQACALVLVPGAPRLPIDGQASIGLDAFALDPGAPGAPARVMTIASESLGDAHSEHVARSFVLGSWPDGVIEDRPSLRLTRAGHYLSRLAPMPAGAGRLGYLWAGDPGKDNAYDTFFSVLDTEAWAVSGEVTVVPGSNADFTDLLRTPTAFLATYTTDSFDTTPKGQRSGFSLGVLDDGGGSLVAATPFTPHAPEPGARLRMFWAGTTVAAAFGHNGCAAGDTLCSPHAVMLARPTAPGEDGVAVDGFAATHVVPGLASTQYVSRPLVTAAFGLLWVLWYEGTDETSTDEHRTIRGMVLAEDGEPIAWPPDDPAPGPIDLVVDHDARSWPSLLVSELGITVAYRSGDTAVEIHHHDFDFKPIGEPIVLAVELEAYQAPELVMLADPRALLLTWPEVTFTKTEFRMARLDCADGR